MSRFVITERADGAAPSAPAAGAPAARTATVPSTATGPVFRVTRLLGGASTLALMIGSSDNLTLDPDTGTISATAAIGAGVAQKAIVREVSGQIAVEYPVTVTGAIDGVAPTPTPGPGPTPTPTPQPRFTAPPQLTIEGGSQVGGIVRIVGGAIEDGISTGFILMDGGQSLGSIEDGDRMPFAAGGRSVDVVETATGAPGTTPATARSASVAVPRPTVTLSASLSQAEGNNGTRIYTYTVTRAPAFGAVGVAWAFAAGPTSPDDYAGGSYPAGGAVALADGQASGSYTIEVVGDAVVEPDEVFTTTIALPPGYASGGSLSATGTIVNDDGSSGLASTARSGTGPQGLNWYNGVTSVRNRSLYGGWQWDNRDANDPARPYIDVPASAYAADGTIAAAPNRGIIHKPHPYRVGGVRERLTLYGTADISTVQGQKPSTTIDRGTNSDGSKWVEYTTNDGFTDRYNSNDTEVTILLGTNGGSITKLITQIRDDYDTTTGLLNANGQKLFDDHFVADLVADYSELRFMDMMNTNGVTTLPFTSANRPKLGDTIPAWQKWGVSYELCVELLKQTGIKSAVFNLPWNCDDSYVRAFAAYLHANLPADVKIRVELANEVWNPAMGVDSPYGLVTAEAGALGETVPKPGTNPPRNYINKGDAEGGDGTLTVIVGYAKRFNIVMGWLKAWCVENGVGCGVDQRFQRMAAWQHVTPGLCQAVIQHIGAGNSDIFATAPYFGDAAWDRRTGEGRDGRDATSADIPVIHERMLMSIDHIIDCAVTIAGHCNSAGIRYTTYEANTHLASTSLAPGGNRNSASHILNMELHQHPFMYNIFNYYLTELMRVVPEISHWQNFAHIGRVTDQGWFAIREYILQTEAESPRYRAFKDWQRGIKSFPTIAVVNSPPATAQGSPLNYVADVRRGAGYKAVRTVSFSNFKLNGTATTAAALGLTTSATAVTGTVSQVGNISFDVTASDASGSITVTKTFAAAAAATFTLDDDLTAVTTEVTLASRGWTAASAFKARNGAAYTTAGGTITRSPGATGLRRRLLMTFDAGGSGSVEVNLFGTSTGATGVRLIVPFTAGGAIILFNGDQFRGNTGLMPAAGLNVLDLKYNPDTREVEISVNNGSPYKRVLDAGDTAGAAGDPIGLKYAGTGASQPLYRRLRVNAGA